MATHNVGCADLDDPIQRRGSRQASHDAGNPLTAGDIIHRVNSFTVRSLDGLRTILEGFNARSRMVRQIERNGPLRFITARLD
jgi:hypothetical protein